MWNLILLVSIFVVYIEGSVYTFTAAEETHIISHWDVPKDRIKQGIRCPAGVQVKSGCTIITNSIEECSVKCKKSDFCKCKCFTWNLWTRHRVDSSGKMIYQNQYKCNFIKLIWPFINNATVTELPNKVPKTTPLFTSSKPKRTPMFTSRNQKRTPMFTSRKPKRTPMFTSRKPTRTPKFTSRKPTRIPMFKSGKPTRTPMFTPQKPTRTPMFTSRRPKRTPIFTYRKPKRKPMFTSRKLKRTPMFTSRKPTSGPMFTSPKPIGMSGKWLDPSMPKCVEHMKNTADCYCGDRISYTNQCSNGQTCVKENCLKECVIGQKIDNTLKCTCNGLYCFGGETCSYDGLCLPGTWPSELPNNEPGVDPLVTSPEPINYGLIGSMGLDGRIG